MKIVYIANSVIPSSSANSVQIMKMCQSLAGLGHKVLLLVSDVKSEISVDEVDPFKFYEVNNTFEIRKINHFSSKGSSFVFAFKSVGVAKREKADLVYTRFVRAGLFCSLFGLPVVYESHKPERGLDSLLLSLLIRNKNLKRVVTISQALAEFYKQRYGRIESKLEVAPDGSDIVDSQLSPATLVSNSKQLQVGYTGQLYKGKGMEIISQLIQRCPDIYFHIIGGDEDKVNEWKETLSENHNFNFYGHVSHYQVSSYIKACDVLLAPYQEDVYTKNENINIGSWMSPLKLFEYMSVGKPIIASDLVILREVLIDENNSLLCSPDNIDDWIKALGMLSNADLREVLGKNAMEDFLSKYTWDIRAKNVLRGLETKNDGK